MDHSPRIECSVGITELSRVALRKIICLERVILDKLGADAAVQGLVEVLEENTGKGRTYLDSQFLGSEGNGALLRLGKCQHAQQH